MIWRVVALLVCVWGAPAVATPFTHDQIIGFSEDGRYFAFKTYGLQRGSGLPHATVFVVDLAQNAWVSGSPFHAGRDETAMAEVEAAPFAALERVRRDAMDAARPMLQDLRIRRPATVLYAAGVGQAHLAREVTRIAIPNPDKPTAQPNAELSLRLSDVPVPATVDYCPQPDALRGYRLELLGPDGAAQVLHEDQRIPASRGCAESYRIDAVVSAGYPQPETAIVALISVWQQGFEGLERHVIAASIPPRTNMQATQTPSRSQPDLDTLVAEFLGEAEAIEPALPQREEAGSGSLRWPDADLPPVARAVEVFAAQDGYAPHGRIWLTEESVEITPSGAGGPFPVSLIRLQAFNLGEARRAELLESLGADAVAPAEAFGAGPDIEWRFVMRPVQGMRADIVAAARLEIPSQDAMRCGPAPCTSPSPFDMESLGLSCTNSEPAPAMGAKTRLGKTLAMQADGGQADEGQASQWLVEHGLSQAGGMQILALDAGVPQSCWWAAEGPD
ncbi:MAG: DUF2259 domain-containing protein [Roseovarius sp.]